MQSGRRNEKRIAADYVCKRLRLLEYLKNEGFIPYATFPDKDNPRYNVWRFKNSPELQKALDAYFSKKKSDKA